MTDRTRMLTSIVYVVFMILTLVAALKWKTKIGTVICCLVQYGALTWYTLSYIPFACVPRVMHSAACLRVADASAFSVARSPRRLWDRRFLRFEAENAALGTHHGRRARARRFL
jgi:hypothetical protein